MDIREQLLDLFDGNGDAVDSFMSRVNSGNVEALTRISRSITDENSTATLEEVVEDETVVDAVEAEEVDVVEEGTDAVEDENSTDTGVEVEEEEEGINEDVIKVELDETFVADLVGSDEFRTHVSELITAAVAEVEARYDEQLRPLRSQVEDNQEWQVDVPVRTKRAVVSYRPRSNGVGVQHTNGNVATATTTENLTHAEIAENSVNDIFGGND